MLELAMDIHKGRQTLKKLLFLVQGRYPKTDIFIENSKSGFNYLYTLSYYRIREKVKEGIYRDVKI